MRYRIYNFIESVKSLFYWLPVIWKDRNYDYSFIYDVLHHKLKAYANAYDKDDRSRIKLCIDLIQRIKDEYYLLEYLDHAVFEGEFLISNISNLDSYFAKYPLIYKNIDKEEDLALQGIKISMINHERAKRLLYRILHENMENWWV